MKVGLFFGSFNPIHTGHLIIATHVVNFSEWKKIWFVVSPQNPLKKSHTLLNEYTRLHLVRLAIEDDIHLKASDVEFHMPKPSYTIDTVTYLKEKYPIHEFSVVMGSDSFRNISKWKNYRDLLDNHPLIIYKRPGFDITETTENQVVLNNVPLLGISATFIRNSIKEGRSIRYLVPEKVREEIEKGRYYKP
jgi:nicotinate-nucleotide adenylyltransferase